MAHDIEHGVFKDKVKVPSEAREDSKLFQRIFYKQRKKAELRAQMHAHSLRPNQCHLVEIDPMPELPLDHLLWGNAAMDKPWLTSYGAAF